MSSRSAWRLRHPPFCIAVPRLLLVGLLQKRNGTCCHESEVAEVLRFLGRSRVGGAQPPSLFRSAPCQHGAIAYGNRRTATDVALSAPHHRKQQFQLVECLAWGNSWWCCRSARSVVRWARHRLHARTNPLEQIASMRDSSLWPATASM